MNDDDLQKIPIKNVRQKDGHEIDDNVARKRLGKRFQRHGLVVVGRKFDQGFANADLYEATFWPNRMTSLQ